MNGAAERLGQTLHGMASAMLKESNLPMKYWSELILASNYLRNRLPVVGRAITPYEARTKHKPCLQHLRRIGQSGFAQNRKPYTGWKHFQDCSTKGTLVGYEGEHIYRMLMPNGQIMRYSNVDWIENFPTKSKSIVETVQPCHITKGNAKNGLLDISQGSKNTATSEDILIPLDFSSSQKQNPPIPPDSPTTSSPLSSPRFSPTPPDHTSDSQQPSTVSSKEQRLTRAQAKSKNIIIAPLSSYPAIEDTSTLLSILASGNNPEPYEPKSYKQATSDHCRHHEDWQIAMQDEIDSLTENNTWSLSTLPSGSQALQGKWVYKIKRGPAGEILRFKARWVVKGFSQREGIDYNETFASVVKPMSYKAIFALCAARDWDIDHMDVKTAFLYGLVEEIIYVIQPTGYSDGSTRVCKLRKALYGLKQSPRIWYQTLAKFLHELGFRPLNADLSVFAKDDMIIAIYVDDLLICGAERKEINKVKDALKAKFHMSDLGPVSFYLGMAVTRDRANKILCLSQEAYLNKFLKDHRIWGYKAVAVPIDGSLTLLL